jgi:hypothetical protein
MRGDARPCFSNLMAGRRTGLAIEEREATGTGAAECRRLAARSAGDAHGKAPGAKNGIHETKIKQLCDEMHMSANQGFWSVWTSFYTAEI